MFVDVRCVSELCNTVSVTVLNVLLSSEYIAVIGGACVSAPQTNPSPPLKSFLGSYLVSPAAGHKLRLQSSNRLQIVTVTVYTGREHNTPHSLSQGGIQLN